MTKPLQKREPWWERKRSPSVVQELLPNTSKVTEKTSKQHKNKNLREERTLSGPERKIELSGKTSSYR